MTGVDISVGCMSAGTAKVVPSADAKLPAPTAALRCICGVDIGHRDTTTLGTTSASLCHRVEEPLGKFPSCAFTHRTVPTDLFDAQVFKHQYGIRRNPPAEFCRGFPAECPTSVGLFTTQPFQHSAYAMRVFVLCLFVGQLFVKTLTSLSGPFVVDLCAKTRDKQGVCLGRRNQSIGRTKINAYRNLTGSIRGFQREAQPCFTAPGNRKAVDLGGRFKISKGVLRYIEPKFLAPVYCGDRKEVVTGKSRVSTP